MQPPVTTEYDAMAQAAPPAPTDWAVRGLLLWSHRRTLARVTAIALIVSLAVAFTIPKRYESTARIMPPDQQSGSGAMVLAALASRTTGLGGLGTLASMLGGHTTTALFISLLRSGTVSGHLIDRFQLQHVYHKRYRIDTAKRLAHRTSITDDKKSGVITIEVEDTDPVRARDLAAAYLDELNKLVTETSTSSARRERIFIERRLHSVQHDLEQAQLALSEFSSKSNAIDIKEETRAIVDASAKVEGELLVEQSGLQSLRQIYGDKNVRVRETEARIASLKAELMKMAGSSAAQDSDASAEGSGKDELYPPLRQIPRLAVPYADLYREVRVQETVFELLTQQYEIARIDEARDIPVVSVIDAPGIAEKKSFPPRLIVTLVLTFLALLGASVIVLLREAWAQFSPADPRKRLMAEVEMVIRRRARVRGGE
jgi:capsule polysaccharide export protein KpsE/RkpR